MKEKIIVLCVLLIVIAASSFLFLKKIYHPANKAKPGQMYALHLLSDTTHLQSNQQTMLTYDIIDDKGEIVKNFAIDHEKLMHLIVVRQDLQDFQHLHPDFNKNTGEFSAPVTFPHDGTYRLYADFSPTNQKMLGDPNQSTPYEDLQVGDLVKYKQQSVLPDTNFVKKVDDYTITYSFPNPIPVGKQVTITAQVTKNGQPVTDMQQYLGAQSHGIILNPDSPYFAHIHAMGTSDNHMNDSMDMSSMSMTNKGPDITFQYTFPRTGVYKLFTQFQHQGKVITSDISVLAIQPESEVSTIDDKASPVQHIIEYENDKIRVVRYIFQPHAKIPMHHAPDVVAIYLTDANLQLVFPDGKVQNEVRKPGEAVYLPSGDHSGENLADTVLEFIAVQLKENS